MLPGNQLAVGIQFKSVRGLGVEFWFLLSKAPHEPGVSGAPLTQENFGTFISQIFFAPKFD